MLSVCTQRGGQRVSYTGIVLLILFWLTLIISVFVAVGGKLKWLDYLYVASYVKLAITLIKYVPQVSQRLSQGDLEVVLCLPNLVQAKLS